MTTNEALSRILARAAEQATKAPTAKKSKTPKECACGCGGMTRGGNWLPGHDAKAYSRELAKLRTKPAITLVA